MLSVLRSPANGRRQRRIGDLVARPRKTRVTLPGLRSPAHARLAADLPHNAEVARAAVDDPYDPGAHITVLRAIRDDPLARLRARDQIDEAQYRAGRAWQADHEAAESGRLASLDLTRIKSDGGAYTGPDTDRVDAARKRLARDRALLGARAEAVLRDVLARGLMLEQVAVRHGHPDARSRYYFGRLFREALETIAKARGLAG